MRIAVLISGRLNLAAECLTSLQRVLGTEHTYEFFASFTKNHEPDLVISDFITTFRPKGLSANDRPDMKYDRFVPLCKPENMMPMWFNRQKLFEMVKQYLDDTGETFDLFVATRADIYYSEGWKAEQYVDWIESNHLCISGEDYNVLAPAPHALCDQHAFGNWHTISIYLQVYSNIPTLMENPSQFFHPESLLFSHLKREGVKVHKYDSQYTIRRC